MTPSLASISAELWFGRIRTLQRRLADGAAIDELLRYGYFTAKLAPGPLADLASVEAGEQALEELLESADYLAAAQLLFADGLLQVEIGNKEKPAVVTVSSSVFDASATVVELDVTRAMLKAWAETILVIEDRAREALTRQVDPAHHTLQFSQHRRLIRHRAS